MRVSLHATTIMGMLGWRHLLRKRAKMSGHVATRRSAIVLTFARDPLDAATTLHKVEVPSNEVENSDVQPNPFQRLP